MSDMNEKEAKWQARLAKSYKDYLITVACCCAGWFILFMGMYGSPKPGGNMFVAFIGYLIIGGPVFLRMLSSRSASSLFFWKDYEVVTTYTDGTKKSDGGVESAQMNLIMMAIMLGLCLVLGGIITLLKVIWLSVKTISCYVAVKQKPAFLHSPFPVLIAGLLVFVFGAVIPQQIGDARFHANLVKVYNDFSNAQDLTAQEARTIIAEAAKNWLAEDHDGVTISSSADQGHILANYSAADGATELLVAASSKKKSVAPIGIYCFAGTDFTQFEDYYNTGKQPGQSDIEAVKKYLPLVFVETLSQVKDSDMFASKKGDDYSFGIRGLDYKKRTGIHIRFYNGQYHFQGSTTGGIETFGDGL
jgi:hypothetical protein